MLSFSRRLVPIEHILWLRSHAKAVPCGYEECGCIGCENKTYEDHILKDDDADTSDPHYKCLRVEDIYIDSDDEQ